MIQNLKEPLKSYLFMFNDEKLTSYTRKIEFKDETTLQLTYLEDEDAYVTNFLKQRILTNIKPTFKCLSLSLLGRDGKIVYTIAFDIAKMSVPYPLILSHDVGIVEMFTTLHITNVNYNCFKKEE